MASSSFRDSINSLGWTRREQDIPVNTSQQSGLLSSIKSLNPFGDRGYVRLPTTEGPGAALPAPTRREEEEGWFVRKSAWLVHILSIFFPWDHLLVLFLSPSRKETTRCRACAGPARLPMSHSAAHGHAWPLFSASSPVSVAIYCSAQRLTRYVVCCW